MNRQIHPARCRKPEAGSRRPGASSQRPAASSHRQPATGYRLPAAGTLLLAVIVSTLVADDDNGRPGQVQLSNGDTIAGAIALAPGTVLQVHDGTRMVPLDFARIREVSFTPEHEEMDQEWRFLEAGKVAKEKTGLPYPLRALAARVQLDGGQEVKGHLFTCALLITDAEDKVHKVILLAKQRGKQGETLAAMTYTARIVFMPAADAAAGAPALTVRFPAGRGPDELVAISRDSLGRMESERAKDGASFALSAAHGAGLFLVARRGNRLEVGWPEAPAGKDPGLIPVLTDFCKEINDFFDDRRIVGAWKSETGELFSLMLLWRKGATTDTPDHPWRMEIWRWKLDGEHALLAARTFAFRGKSKDEAGLPTVTSSPELWAAKQVGNAYVVGENP